MAFTVPDFVVSVDVFSGPWLTRAFRFNVLGNLTLGRRVFQQFQTDDDAQVVVGTTQDLLLLPLHTDVRTVNQGVPNDVMEIPSGSGRWYGVNAVEVVAMGFPNEHVVAVITQISQAVDNVRYAGLVWPIPMT